MAFNVENGAGVALEIDDLGITLEVGEITDLAVRGDPAVIAISSVGAGDEIYDLVASGDLIVKDPFDGATNLSVADGIACIQSVADPHWRVGQGARIGDISDVTITTPAEDETIKFDGSGWVNSPGGGGFSGLGIWRYRTAITSTPTSGQLQFDNITIDSATELYVNVVNDGGTDMSTFLALITSGSFIYLQLQSDASQFAVVQVGASTLLSGVYTFPITGIKYQGTAPANNARVALVVSGSGSGGGSSTFGSEYQTEEDDTISATNDDTTFQTKLTLTTPSLPAGTYRIGFYNEMFINSDKSGGEFEIDLNSGTIVAQGNERPKNKDNIIPNSGFKHVALSGVNTIDMNWRVSQGDGTSSIQRARLELWRVL